MAWQAWHLVRRGTCGTGLDLVARLGPIVAAALCVAGVALGDIHHCFAWQGPRLDVNLRFVYWRRTWRRRPSFCLGGLALVDIDLRLVWQAWHLWHWWRAWGPLLVAGAAALCVAGVAHGDIHLRFAWQGWHLVTSTFGLRGGLALMALGWIWWRAWGPLVAGDAVALCVAGVALAPFCVAGVALISYMS